MPPRSSSPAVFAPAVPAWARQLISAVCAEAGASLPDRVTWTVKRSGCLTSSGKTSSRPGATSNGRSGQLRRAIMLSVGTDLSDQRHVILHELAHFLDPEAEIGTRPALTFMGHRTRRVRRDPHNLAFFGRLIPLLAARGSLSLEAALTREVQTYPSHAGDLARALAASPHAALLPTVRAAKAARNRARDRVVVLVPSHAIAPVARGKLFFCATCNHRLGPTTMTRYRRLLPQNLAHLLRHRVMGLDPTAK